METVLKQGSPEFNRLMPYVVSQTEMFLKVLARQQSEEALPQKQRLQR